MREWIIGRNPVYETLRARRRQVFQLQIAEGVQEKGRLTEIIRECTHRRISVKRIPRVMMDSHGAGNQGVALETSKYPYSSIVQMFEHATRQSEAPFILILDALRDPQNLGTLLRTAEAVGVHGVLLPLRQTVTVTPTVVHASSGASEHLLISQVNLAQAIKTLKDREIWVIGLDDSSAIQLPNRVQQLDGPLALVVGSEGSGMRPLVRDSCDLLMSLPMRGEIESLNASVAGSIALYLVWQMRNFSGISSKNH
jgi:23S rRNA (guanosine2251-2'-O)-methyltransferase